MLKVTSRASFRRSKLPYPLQRAARHSAKKASFRVSRPSKTSHLSEIKIQKKGLRSWSWTPQSEGASHKKLTVLRCYKFGALVKGRVDNVRGLNLRRSVDKSCHRLQHLRISIGVVSFGISFVIPQTDCRHINSTGTSESYFVLKTILFTKQRKNVLLKSSRVIGERIGFQMNRNIACKHRQPPRVEGS